MARIIHPLRKFGANFYPKNKNTLPIGLKGTNYLRPIDYLELKGSSQCKSSVMLAAMLTPGETNLKCKPSRNHTELFFKYLKIPVKIKKSKNFELIKVKGEYNFKSFNYKIPGDISSSAFFIALTVLSKNSKILIKNVNVNNSRTRPTHVRTTKMFIVLSKGKENAYFKKNGSQRYCPFVMEKSQGFVKHKSA